MQPISHHALLSPRLLDSVTSRYGQPLVAALPPVSPDDDTTEAFAALHGQLEAADVVLFPDIWPGDLDAFFRLRLVQVLAGQAPQPGLSVVVLSTDIKGPKLAGGFADRFRCGWPFARCVFLTEGTDHAALAATIGLPVGPLDDPVALTSDAAAGQAVAVLIQPAWGRCGSTILFENQTASLVQAGLLTIRVFADAQWRRGATMRSRLDRLLPENSVLAGAHINVTAVPDGPPSRPEALDVDSVWRNNMAATATCRIRDAAVLRGAALAAGVIVNRIEGLGPALMFAPGARLLLALQEDRAAAVHHFALRAGRTPETAARFALAADHVQSQVLGIADVCAFVSATEATRLGPRCRRSVVIPPRMAPAPVADAGAARFDVLLTAAEDALNVAALRWFLDQVWRPHLEPHGISVLIAGRAGPHVREAARGSPLVRILGFVADLDAIRAWCRLTVVPDLARAGLSAKLLDAMAAGHPVATTQAGLRGLPPAVADGLPAHDAADALAADIIGLIQSPDRLAARRTLVRRLHAAIPPGGDHAGSLMALPHPSGPGIRKRLERWVRLAGPARSSDGEPYLFQYDIAFPLSGSPFDARVLLDGWHEAESWGRWMDGADATLRISLAAPATELLTLELEIVPSAVAANLRVGWNGTMLPLIDPVPGVNAWDIPAELTTGQSSFVVSLHAGDTVQPAAAGNSVDDRVLGIGVASVRVVSRQPTLCQPDVWMPIRADAMPRQVLLTGWHGPEAWGCWTSTTTASLCLTLRQPVPASLRLELDLAVPPIDTRLTVSVNGVALPTIAPVDGGNIWEPPVRVTNGRTELRLLLSVPQTFCAARAGAGTDDRELGIGLRGIRLLPFVPVYHDPGTPQPLVSTEALGEILLGGWHPAEDWGCWTDAREARLRLVFRQPLSGPFRLEMELLPLPTGTTLTLSVNGQALPAVAPIAGLNSWTLPERQTEDQRDLVLGLRVSSLFCPADRQDSTDRRLLGVGVRWVTLQREASATCPIGALVRISSEAGDRGMLIAGWHPPEPWGCWSSGSDASLRLRFAEPLAGSYMFEADLMPPLLPGPVVVLVNGIALDPMPVFDGPNEWRLPRSCTDGQIVLTLQLRVALPARPMDVIESTDDRVLGIALRSFRIRALRWTDDDV